MVAIELAQLHWIWAMLAGGVFLCWLIYLALYAGPDRPRGEEVAADAEEDAHQFPEGIRETNMRVPLALKLFFTVMGVWALLYVAWIRLYVGSY